MNAMAFSSFRYHDYFRMLTIENMSGKELMLEDQPYVTINCHSIVGLLLTQLVVRGIISHMPLTIIGID